MSLITDILGTTQEVLGVKNLAEYFTLKNQLTIDKGVMGTSNTIAQLNATADLLRLQNQAIQNQTAAANAGSIFGNIDVKKLGGYALLAGGAYLAYKFLVK